MRKRLPALALALLLAGCGPAASSPPPAADNETRVMPPELVIPEEQPKPAESSDTEESPDRVLSSLSASVGGRTLRLDAIGAFLEDRGGHCGIREVQVYRDGTLVQTVPASSAPLSDSGSGYTESASVNEAMAVRDMNFDGFDDLELADWSSTGTNPHHFWLWDVPSGRFVYAFTLRGAEAVADTGEITASYNEGGMDYLDTYTYQPGTSTLVFQARRTEDWKNGTEDFALVDYYTVSNGEPVLLREEFTDYNDDGMIIREVREPVDGELKPVRMERLEMDGKEFRVVETIPIEPAVPENPEEYPEEGPYPWEENLDGEYPLDGDEYPYFPEDTDGGET